ncbi:Pycsar system effector family protein [Patescibacteria group bacterium]
MQNFNLTFLQSELNRVSEWIQFSDKKTAFLSAFYSAVFGLVLAQKESILQDFAIQQKWINYICSFILFCFIVSFVVGIFFLFRSIFPRLKNSFTDKSLFYFGHIANMKFVDYSSEIKKMTEEDAKRQIIEQIYTNSIIANQKMENVQNSIKSFVVLILFTILLILI